MYFFCAKSLSSSAAWPVRQRNICQARVIFFSPVFTRVIHWAHILAQEAHSA